MLGAVGGGGFRGGNMPKSLSCYICGRAYGTASISIHIKACTEKWNNEQAKKPPKERRKLPQPPPEFLMAIGKGNISEDRLEEVNNMMYQQYKEKVLEQCQFCGRSFNNDAMKVHKRLCNEDKPHAPLNKDKIRANSQSPNNPKITDDRPIKPGKADQAAMNVDQFEAMMKQEFQPKKSKTPQKEPKTFGIEVGQLEVKNSKSSKIPNAFDNSNNSRPLNSKNIKNPSEIRIKSNPKKSMPPEEINYNMLSNECAKCGRKFAMDRLDKHQSVCKVNSKPKKVKRFHKVITPNDKAAKKSKAKPKWKEQHNNLMEVVKHMRQIKKAEDHGIDIRTIQPLPTQINSNLIQCSGCGRRFNPDAHAKHEKACLQKQKDIAYQKGARRSPNKIESKMPIKQNDMVFTLKSSSKPEIKQPVKKVSVIEKKVIVQEKSPNKKSLTGKRL